MGGFSEQCPPPPPPGRLIKARVNDMMCVVSSVSAVESLSSHLRLQVVVFRCIPMPRFPVGVLVLVHTVLGRVQRDTLDPFRRGARMVNGHTVGFAQQVCLLSFVLASVKQGDERLGFFSFLFHSSPVWGPRDCTGYVACTGGPTPRVWTPTTPPTNCWPEAPRGGGGGGLGGGVLGGALGGGGRPLSCGCTIWRSKHGRFDRTTAFSGAKRLNLRAARAPRRVLPHRASGAFGAHGLLRPVPLTTNCWPLVLVHTALGRVQRDTLDPFLRGARMVNGHTVGVALQVCLLSRPLCWPVSNTETNGVPSSHTTPG